MLKIFLVLILLLMFLILIVLIVAKNKGVGILELFDVDTSKYEKTLDNISHR